MRMRVGTSGFGYDQWEGGFYPAGLSSDDRLAFYAERFRTVELNNTFYRMPKRDVLRRWAAAVPESFRFAVKASRRITHEGRFEDTGGVLEVLLRQLEVLGERRGPILFQAPHYLRKNVDKLRAFVARLPPGTLAAFELRHRGWNDPEVHELLASAGHAWCEAEHEPSEAKPGETEAKAGEASTPESSASEASTVVPSTPESSASVTATPEPSPLAGERPLVRTASWGYVRLHAASYDDAALLRWVERMRDTWDDAWVFFSHEDTGPQLVQRMVALARRLPGVELP
jgi:uncharacterized protein YecE (DUF72 family)